MRPLLVLAGTFAPKRFCSLYYSSLYPTRVVALPRGGRDRLHRTYDALHSTVLSWAEHQDEPIVLAGHSQGAIHALSFALDHPDLVNDVVGVAGPFDGANSPLLAPNLERQVKWILPVGLDFRQGSSYLEDLRERAASSTVPTTLVAGTTDMLVSTESAHALHPANKVTVEGGHTTVLRQRETKRLLRDLRER